MKCREATLAGRRRGGSFNLRIDSSGSLDEPPRPRQTRCLRAIFLDGAATPPLPRRGVFASYRFVLNSSTSGALKFTMGKSPGNGALGVAGSQMSNVGMSHERCHIHL